MRRGSMMWRLLLFSVESRFPQRNRPYNPALSLLQLFHANDQIEEHEKEDADRGYDDSIFLILDTRDEREIRKDARLERDDADGSPKKRPEDHLPDSLFLTHHEAPRVQNRDEREDRDDDLVGREGHGANLSAKTTV
jgi:hypothetical protein